MTAPNDNNLVMPWIFEPGHLSLLSDTVALVDVDPVTLNFKREFGMMSFKNASNPLSAPVTSGASAHPHCGEDGSYIGLREASTVTKGLGESRMAVYKLQPDKPNVIQDIVHVDMPQSS